MIGKYPESWRPEAGEMATRVYWDTVGAEAEGKDLEEKILDLGVFVARGGRIADAVNIYVQNTDDADRLDAVQWAIYRYLEYMMNAKERMVPYRYWPLALRIMRLDKEELLELLERELTRCVEWDWPDKYIITGVSSPYDINLDDIERRHWRAHPEEPFSRYWDKTRFWDRRYPGLWRKKD
ncbi:MAG: hypothetical protein J5771_07520 [Bacteroidales bacterium]|nr:hypothetical protein [Bacteroidales bacterium]